MAGAQKKYPGRLWASAAVPLQDTRAAIEVVDDAVNRLGLMGVNLPGSVGADARIDAERLEPFYAHVEKLGLPLFLHPTDVIFQDMLDGYDGALHLSLGRVIEVCVAAMRLILSGMMERHPNLKIVMSHTGGSLPYQAGRMDKNSKAAKLPRPVQDYMKRMYTDTVSPHSAGIKFAIDYYGIDHVMYGTDYPCWDPAPCLKLIDEIKLSDADKQKLFYDNARRILEFARSGAGEGTPSASRRWCEHFPFTASAQSARRCFPICRSRRASCSPRNPCRRCGGRICPDFMSTSTASIALAACMMVSSPSTAQLKPSWPSSSIDRIGVWPPISGLQICGTSKALPMRSSSVDAARRLDENAVGAGADIALGAAHGLVEVIDRARVGAAEDPGFRIDAARTQAALILASASSIGTTFLPTMWPQRFGHCWSSIRMALTPMRS